MEAERCISTGAQMNCRITVQRLITSKLGSFFLILPYVKPAAEVTGSFDILFDLWKLVSAALIIIGCIQQIGKSSKIVYSISIIQIVMFFATILHRGDIKGAIVQMLSSISICLYFDYFLRKNPRKALEYISRPLVYMSILVVLTMIITYPNGMYSIGDDPNGYIEKGNYLWGFDNASIFNFLPGMCMFGFYSYLENNRRINRRTVFFYIIVTLAFAYVFSITAAIVCALITIGYIIVILKRIKLRILTVKNVTVTAIIFALILIFVNENLGILMRFADKTDKYWSIMFRFNIWKLVLKWWKQAPLLGYGIERADDIVSKIVLDHPHNYFLDVLYRGGVIGLLCAIWTFMNMSKGKWADTGVNSFAATCFFSVFVVAQFDFYNDHYLFYPMLLVVAHSRKFRRSNNTGYVA